MMQTSAKSAEFPPAVQTLGALIDASVALRAICSNCERWVEIDKSALARRVGRDYSLINRRTRCKLTKRCRGWNRFYYAVGEFLPLWDTAMLLRWMAHDAGERPPPAC